MHPSRWLDRPRALVVGWVALMVVAPTGVARGKSDLRVVDTQVLAGKTRVLRVGNHLDGFTGRLPIFVLRPGLECQVSLCPHVGDSLKGLGRNVPTLNVDTKPVGTCDDGFSVVVGTVSRRVAKVVALTDGGERPIKRRLAPRAWKRAVYMLGQFVPAPYVYAVEARDTAGHVLARSDVLVPGACSAG